MLPTLAANYLVLWVLQIDGHHVEYDVLQLSQMMDVLNSAGWTEIFSERGFQFVSIFLTVGQVSHWSTAVMTPPRKNVESLNCIIL